MITQNNPEAWSNPKAVEFYTEHRTKARELYPSEQYFLSDVLKSGKTTLDVGCAVGGLFAILKPFNPALQYTGIDISESMIDRARQLYPEARFEVARGDGLDFPEASFDIVISFGVLPMILHWRRLLTDMWRVTRKRLLFDLRLTPQGQTIADIKISFQRTTFDSENDKKNHVPYVIVNMQDTLEALKALKPLPTIRTFGYFHQVSPTAQTPYKEVCMTTFCLEKNSKTSGGLVEWKTPLPRPKIFYDPRTSIRA